MKQAAIPTRLRRPMPPRCEGAVLVTVLVFVLAGMALAAAASRTGMLELAMADRGANRLRASEAAEKGRMHALLSRAWSATETWTDAGTLDDGAQWQVEVRLALAHLDVQTAEVDWHFEIHSEGRAGTAHFAMLQGFVVTGALPGEPRLTWWRQPAAAP